MADSQLSAPESLWRVITPASVVECRLRPLDQYRFELSISQDEDVILCERFWSEDTARTYASRLHEKVVQLSVEAHRRRAS